MVAIGFGLLWVSYTGGLWAYCLLRGYDITPAQLINPVHPYTGPWPPPPIPAGLIFPGGQPAATSTVAKTGTGKGKGTGTGKGSGTGSGPPVQAV
jgi:hypothetical protein